MGYVTPLSKTIERIKLIPCTFETLCVLYEIDEGVFPAPVKSYAAKKVRKAVRAILYKHRERVTQSNNSSGLITYSYTK